MVMSCPNLRWATGNLKENAIEQKLIAMQARMQEEDEEAVGPDQMLDEACQLAVQLHELSNNESIYVVEYVRMWHARVKFAPKEFFVQLTSDVFFGFWGW